MGDRVGGTSSINDFTLAAEACLPLISSILVEIKTKTFPQKCFLNVDLPTNVLNHKVSEFRFLFLFVNCNCMFFFIRVIS